MNDYYCKNCKNKIGKWHTDEYDIEIYCFFTASKNIDSVFFLDCIYCKKFVGIVSWDICEHCFGKDEILKKDEIIEKEILFNWFLKNKEIINFSNNCKICNKDYFRRQCWFFKELTFSNINI